MHGMVYHVPGFMERHQGIKKFTGQGIYIIHYTLYIIFIYILTLHLTGHDAGYFPDIIICVIAYVWKYMNPKGTLWTLI